MSALEYVAIGLLVCLFILWVWLRFWAYANMSRLFYRRSNRVAVDWAIGIFVAVAVGLFSGLASSLAVLVMVLDILVIFLAVKHRNLSSFSV